MTGKIYDIALAKMGTSDIYWDSGGDTFKLVLMTNSYTFNSSHETYANLTNEIGATGSYSSGGVGLTLKVTTYGGGVLYFGADTLVLTGITATFRKLAIYDSTVDNNLLLYIDLGEDVSLTNENYTLMWNGDAIWYGVMGGGAP